MIEPAYLSARARPHYEWAAEHWADHLADSDAETLALWAESRADAAQARKNLERSGEPGREDFRAAGPFVKVGDELRESPWYSVAIAAERRCSELQQRLGIT